MSTPSHQDPPAPKRTGPRRTNKQREAHYEYIRKMRLRGYTLREIAEKLDLTAQQIWVDNKVVKARAAKREDREYAELHQTEIDRLDDLQTEAWRAWQTSLQEKRTRIIRQIKREGREDDQQYVEQRIAESTGDARYLEVVRKVILDRCTLLGIPDSTIGQQEQLQAISHQVFDMYQAMLHTEGLAPGPTGLAVPKPPNGQPHPAAAPADDDDLPEPH